MTCSNLDMTSTKQPDASRKLYQWRCKKNHQILEAYYLRERVLVSPVECSDYNKRGACKKSVGYVCIVDRQPDIALIKN
ncbi:MAG: hypothetical protein R3E36_12365 [Nitrosomonas sp.]|nr:hypothetical protein [Burkholderiales bacterium]MCP5291917.1 hypothetical protein [Burkholderiales bacterium]MDR4521365.1 hypothetical protein [Nitrosomonas sp.]